MVPITTASVLGVTSFSQPLLHYVPTLSKTGRCCPTSHTTARTRAPSATKQYDPPFSSSCRGARKKSVSVFTQHSATCACETQSVVYAYQTASSRFCRIERAPAMPLVRRRFHLTHSRLHSHSPTPIRSQSTNAPPGLRRGLSTSATLAKTPLAFLRVTRYIVCLLVKFHTPLFVVHRLLVGFKRHGTPRSRFPRAGVGGGF
jgi:hypothetical protein